MFLKFLFKFKEKSVKRYELNGLDIPRKYEFSDH